MTETPLTERQATALKAWLESPPGSTPPSDLDGEVVQTVFALRPDLAPAPRLTAEDILAGVTAGPLAANPGASRANGAGGAEIVPFPSARAPAPTPEADAGEVRARRPRWSRWLGGGMGLALAAAATLVVVALPLTRPMGDAAPSADQSLRFGAGAQAPTTPVVVAAPPSPEEAQAPQIATRAAAPALAPSPQQAGPVVLGMQDGPLYRQTTVIPEALEPRGDPSPPPALAEAPSADLGAVGGVEAGEQATQPEVAAKAASDVVDRVDSARERAVDKLSAGTGWRKGVDSQVLTRIDQAITEAEALRMAGNPRAAGDRLAQVVGPPTRAGQYVAQLAAQDYLAAGDVTAAMGVAQRGLGLGASGSPERSALLVVYGDALRESGDRTGAADAYDQAR